MCNLCSSHGLGAEHVFHTWTAQSILATVQIGYKKWVGCRCRAICWSIATVRNSMENYCSHLGLWAKLWKDCKTEDVALLFISLWVCLSVFWILYYCHFPKSAFWQYAHFSNHNWLIGGQMSEVTWIERGGRACPVGPGVQTALLWERRMLLYHRTGWHWGGFWAFPHLKARSATLLQPFMIHV